MLKQRVVWVRWLCEEKRLSRREIQITQWPFCGISPRHVGHSEKPVSSSRIVHQAW